MGRLDAALARFTAALDILETRAGAVAANMGPGSAELAREVNDLKRERERLLTRITALEEESQSLAGLTEQVEIRLDGAIAEIRAALGRG
jgi:hypothetical protein